MGDSLKMFVVRYCARFPKKPGGLPSGWREVRFRKRAVFGPPRPLDSFCETNPICEQERGWLEKNQYPGGNRRCCLSLENVNDRCSWDETAPDFTLSCEVESQYQIGAYVVETSWKKNMEVVKPPGPIRVR